MEKGTLRRVHLGALLLAAIATNIQAQDRQACEQAADSCETACAVGSLAGVLLSRGKGDGNKANAECAAKCQAEKQSCLGNATTAQQPLQPSVPQPAVQPMQQPSGFAGGGVQNAPSAPGSQGHEHDPAGVANQCMRANIEDSYGGFTNTCNVAVSYIHCFYRPQRNRHDSEFFNCERPGGLWAKSTTAGNVKPGARNGTGIPIGGQIFTIACREPYSIRDAFFDGTTLRAKCVASGGTLAGGAGAAPAPAPVAAPVQRPVQQPQQRPAGQDMAHCLKLERVQNSTWPNHLVNRCGVTVEATWCTEGGSAGDDCSRGFRNLWTIGAGRSYPVQGKFTRVRWGACKGANTLRGVQPNALSYRCEG